MVYRSWKQPKSKINNYKNKKHKPKYKNGMKIAQTDEEDLKRKKKRLHIDWFFRPQGD